MQMPRITLAAIVAAALSLAWAGEAAGQASPDPDGEFDFAIEAQPLSTAIQAFSRQTRRAVVANSSDIESLRSQAVQGRMSAEEGLRRLVQDTGLVIEVVDGVDFSLRPDLSTPPTDDGRSARVDEVVVIGEKLNRNLMQTMTSTNIQTADLIERNSDRRIQDSFQRVANIVGSRNLIFSVRGVSSAGTGFSSAPLASVFIDGAQTTFNQLSNGVGNLFDVEQVEVLRGPQSTSQGGAAMAGAVFLATKDPTFEWDNVARFEVAEYNTYRLSLAHGGPINSAFAYRVVLDYDQTDGFVENPVRGTDDDEFIDKRHGRFKLLYKPQGSKLDALLTYSRLDGENGYNNLPWNPEEGEFINRNPFRNTQDVDQEMLTLEIGYDLNEQLRFTSLTSATDYEGVFLENRVVGTVPDVPEDLITGFVIDEIFTQELRLNFDSQQWRGLAGLFYNDKNRGRIQFGSQDHVNQITPIDGDFLFESYSVFTEVDINLTEHWTLTLGGRYEEVDSTATNNNAGMEEKGDDSSFVGKAGIRYTFNNDHVAGFTFSQGYRPGGVVTIGEAPYDPEFLDNYELSYRGRFMDGRIALNANLFYFDWKDLQTLVFVVMPVFDFQILNAGRAHSYGGELELTAYPTDQLELFASIGTTNGEFDDFVSGFGDFSGNEFEDAPPVNAGAGFFQNWGRFALGMNAEYTASYYTNPQNTQEADSRTVVNLTVRYQPIEDLSVTAYVNNLFDERYRDAFGVARPLVPGGPSVQATGPLGDPRQIGVRVQASF